MMKRTSQLNTEKILNDGIDFFENVSKIDKPLYV